MCVCVCARVGAVFYTRWYFSEEVNLESMAKNEEEPAHGHLGEGHSLQKKQPA